MLALVETHELGSLRVSNPQRSHLAKATKRAQSVHASLPAHIVQGFRHTWIFWALFSKCLVPLWDCFYVYISIGSDARTCILHPVNAHWKLMHYIHAPCPIFNASIMFLGFLYTAYVYARNIAFGNVHFECVRTRTCRLCTTKCIAFNTMCLQRKGKRSGHFPGFFAFVVFYFLLHLCSYYTLSCYALLSLSFSDPFARHHFCS